MNHQVAQLSTLIIHGYLRFKFLSRDLSFNVLIRWWRHVRGCGGNEVAASRMITWSYRWLFSQYRITKTKCKKYLKKKIKRKQNNNALAEFIFLLLLRSFPANVCEVSLIPAQTDEAGKQDKRLSVRSIIINNFRCRQITITDSLRNKRRGFLCSRILLRTQTFLDLNASAHAQKWKFQLNNN